MNADEIRANTFVRHVEIHDELGSTNNRAAELARDTLVELPALVVTRRQTAGRGRGRNTWWSAEGALTFSLLLDPAGLGIETVRWPQVSLATAVAVCDALTHELEAGAVDAGATGGEIGSADAPARLAIRLGIKWPNDVILDGGKVCGILIESPGGGAPAKDRLIVGIGINVNNAWCSAPQAAGVDGIALCDATLNALHLDAILIRVLQAIRERIDQLAAHDPQLPAAWQRLCWLTEQRIEVQSNGNSMAGICREIDADGSLILENAFGIHRIRTGSVRLTPS
jgi:BirA family transcriptional regulator, biotin operon repressor / biotin---[acetyl-CoA-carboxylase] ligase